MNWRGRTVEYSCDPAKGPLWKVFCIACGRFLRLTPDLYLGFAARPAGGWRKVLSINGLGLAANNPIFREVYDGNASRIPITVAGCPIPWQLARDKRKDTSGWALARDDK